MLHKDESKTRQVERLKTPHGVYIHRDNRQPTARTLQGMQSADLNSPLCRCNTLVSRATSFRGR